jgi:hypothetical protein
MSSDSLATTNLVSPDVWSANSTAPVVIGGGLNVVTNPLSGPQQFYRLKWQGFMTQTGRAVLLLLGHDQLVHDVVFALGRVLAMSKLKIGPDSSRGAYSTLLKRIGGRCGCGPRLRRGFSRLWVRLELPLTDATRVRPFAPPGGNRAPELYIRVAAGSSSFA